MAVKFESGTWTANGSASQTINFDDVGFGTPIALIARMQGQGAVGAGFTTGVQFSMGFGTRQGGSTQQGSIGIFDENNVNTSSSCRRVDTNSVLYVFSDGSQTLDYTVSLTSFGSAQFTVTYSNGANASGDVFEYVVLGGDELTNAKVINHVMDSTGATEVVTGTGFANPPSALFGLDAGCPANTGSSSLLAGFGFASSDTKFQSLAAAANSGASATGDMRYHRSWRTDAFLERLDPTADATDAYWDVASFDADGATLGVLAAPNATDQVCPLLFIEGGIWEAGVFQNKGSTGDKIITLSNGTLIPDGVILGNVGNVSPGISPTTYRLGVGACSTADPVQANAVNHGISIAGGELIPTRTKRYLDLDSGLTLITDFGIEEEAWFDGVGAGEFTLHWSLRDLLQWRYSYMVVGGTSIPDVRRPVYPDFMTDVAVGPALQAYGVEPVTPPRVDVWPSYPETFNTEAFAPLLQFEVEPLLPPFVPEDPGVLVRWPALPRHREQRVELWRVLDLAGIVPTPRDAKQAIRAGAVRVDGVVETDLRRTLLIGTKYNVTVTKQGRVTGGDLTVIAASGLRRSRQTGSRTRYHKG